MRTHPLIIVVIVLIVACFLPLIIVCLTDSKPSHARTETSQASTGCACAATPAHVTKFLIFWKEKEKEGEKEVQVFKISDKLFDSVVDAWKTVPPNAAEVRIITVRID